MVGQLKRDGSIGERETFGFVPANVIAERLKEDGTDMCLTIGLSYRRPTTHNKRIANEKAIEFLKEYEHSYTYEACYVDSDDMLHVTALSDNDLF